MIPLLMISENLISEQLRWGAQLRNSWTCNKPWTLAMAHWPTADCQITTLTGVRTVMMTSLSSLTCMETRILTTRTGDQASRCWRSGFRAPSLRMEGLESHWQVDCLRNSLLYSLRPPGLVQSVLAPVIGLSTLNLAYSPGAKRIDVMARSDAELRTMKMLDNIFKKLKIALGSWAQFIVLNWRIDFQVSVYI